MSSSLLMNIKATVLKMVVINILCIYTFNFPPCSHLVSSTGQIPTSQSKDSSSPDLKLSPWCRIAWQAAWSVAYMYICPRVTDGPRLDITQLCRWVSADIVKILKVSPRAACCCSRFHSSEDGVRSISSCDLQVCQAANILFLHLCIWISILYLKSCSRTLPNDLQENIDFFKICHLIDITGQQENTHFTFYSHQFSFKTQWTALMSTVYIGSSLLREHPN